LLHNHHHHPNPFHPVPIALVKIDMYNRETEDYSAREPGQTYRSEVRKLY
jgi:hypothetical protein